MASFPFIPTDYFRPSFYVIISSFIHIFPLPPISNSFITGVTMLFWPSIYFLDSGIPLFISLDSFIILPLIPCSSNSCYFKFFIAKSNIQIMFPFHSQYSSRTNSFSLFGILSSSLPFFLFVPLFLPSFMQSLFTLLIFNLKNSVKTG